MGIIAMSRNSYGNVIGCVICMLGVLSQLRLGHRFSKKKELAFIATLTMVSEIGNDGDAGDTGVPHSINISSDSPSAISDSFGQSETTAGTRNNRNLFNE